MKFNLERNIRHLNLHICKPEWIVENELPAINVNPDITIGHIISFSKSLKSDDNDLGIHFFEDDRYFERVWTHPEKYIHHLKKVPVCHIPGFLNLQGCAKPNKGVEPLP